MMNKMPTNKANRLRLLVVLPLVTILLVAFRSAALPEETDTPTSVHQQDNALYYIDGKKASKEQANKLTPDAIHSVDIFKGEHAKKVPGNKDGKDVISLTTTKNKDSEQVRRFNEKVDKFENKLPQTDTKQRVPDVGLYFIDGVEATKQAAEKLDPKEINSINVYKGEGAVETFGNKASKGVISIITENNKNSRQVQEFNKKLPTPPVPPAPGTPPPPPAPGEPGTPPPPPAPAVGQLPPPPPPVKYEGPAVPKAGGARLVENEDYVLYILWPEEITKRELEVAQRAFKESGFDLRFDEKHTDGKISGLKIELSSKKNNSHANATYNATSLKSLMAADNIVLVRGNKKTGEVTIGTTLAPR